MTHTYGVCGLPANQSYSESIWHISLYIQLHQPHLSFSIFKRLDQNIHQKTAMKTTYWFYNLSIQICYTMLFLTFSSSFDRLFHTTKHYRKTFKYILQKILCILILSYHQWLWNLNRQRIFKRTQYIVYIVHTGTVVLFDWQTFNMKWRKHILFPFTMLTVYYTVQNLNFK